MNNFLNLTDSREHLVLNGHNRNGRAKKTLRSAVFSCALVAGLSGCLTNPNQPPELLRGDTLVFPAQARADGIEGVVEVRYDVLADGRVSNAEIISAEPALVFDEAALSAVSGWRFRPGRERGTPVDFKGMVSTVRFTFGDTDYPTR